ncbi:Ribonuclease III [Serinicoccus hydrothermalis]|uniref:Ribonuclease 3 n=1 Tax=Serinicoccus hydrothermalis TaxID=1758689 RepID=A0A1B1NGS7_9MICO|nr:ribonuclease III [Serinicoccus hydrothermalis]ANS80647.1 Ribonuclease III [Serinicoccus hydrothermalis]
MRPVSELADRLAEVVGEACDEALLLRALTHRSFSYENDGQPHNERLEFLGDSVLGVVVTDALYRTHPDLTEGQLAKLRAAVVNSRALAEVARVAELGDFVLLGKGEEATGGRDKDSILADTTEAVIGCVYLSSGLPAASTYVHHVLDPLMRRSAGLGAALDWKTSLQEVASAGDLGQPQYLVDAEGPDHSKTFTARAVVADEVVGTGVGRSKKLAEQQAAEQGWQLLTERAAQVVSTEPTVEAATGDGPG